MKDKMKLYNIYYKSGNEITRKSNVTAGELYDFIKNLKHENDCELRVQQVKNKEYEEVER